MRALICLALFVPLLAGARPLRVCVDRNDWVPYTYGERDGTLQIQLKQVAPKVGFSVEVITLPWQRCKTEVARGAIDALLAASANADALRLYALPMRGAQVDTARALLQTELVFMRASGSAVSWDGKVLTGLQGQVMIVQNYRDVAAALREHGIPADSGGTTNEQNAQKVLAGRGNTLATYAGDAHALLDRPEYRGKLELLTPPLVTSAYYLALNKDFYQANTAQAEALWKALAAPGLKQR